MSEQSSHSSGDPKQDSILPAHDGPQAALQSGVEKLASRGGNSLIEMLSMTASMGGNPLHQKMTPEHITQVLGLAEKHDEREFELSKQQQKNELSQGNWDRAIHCVYVIILFVLIIVVIHVFKDQPAVLTPILSGLGGGIAGFFGGVGYATRSK